MRSGLVKKTGGYAHRGAADELVLNGDRDKWFDHFAKMANGQFSTVELSKSRYQITATRGLPWAKSQLDITLTPAPGDNTHAAIAAHKRGDSGVAGGGPSRRMLQKFLSDLDA